ncbi:uncharacterized protein [Cebidichthys violaceus]
MGASAECTGLRCTGPSFAPATTSSSCHLHLSSTTSGGWCLCCAGRAHRGGAAGGHAGPRTPRATSSSPRHGSACSVTSSLTAACSPSGRRHGGTGGVVRSSLGTLTQWFSQQQRDKGRDVLLQATGVIPAAAVAVQPLPPAKGLSSVQAGQGQPFPFNVPDEQPGPSSGAP